MITDLKYALRMLIKAPGFAVIAILTLALGIGANSAIFSVIDTVLLRPLPFKNPDEIVMIWGRYANDTGPVRGNVHSYPDFVDLRDQSQSIASMAAYTRTAGTLSYAEDAKYLEGLAITPGVFDVLGVQPLLGRGFTEEDAKNEADRVVILSYNLWRTAFGGDPKIVGQQVMLSSRPHTVIGVMPPSWKFPIEDEHIDYALPLQYFGMQMLNRRGAHFLSVVGRLKPGVSNQKAEAETTAIVSRLSKQYPDTNMNLIGCAVVTLHSDVVGNVRPALIVMLGAVALVLLIACANVANLPLARAVPWSSANCFAKACCWPCSAAPRVCCSPGGASIFSAPLARKVCRISARSKSTRRWPRSPSCSRLEVRCSLDSSPRFRFRGRR